ncbi:MAG: hypothetical protein ACRD2L_08405 [Terriglobia bacterium]
MENLINSIKAVLYERTASPLFGALAVSWLAWNYQVVVVLFSEMPVLQKLAHIEEKLYPTLEASVCFLLVYPLATALLYLFVLPYPARFVHRFWRARQKELRDDRLEIENASLLTVEESRRIRQSVIEIQADYDDALRKSQAEAERLKDQIGERQQEIETLQKDLSDLRSAGTSDETAEPVEDSMLESILRSKPYRLYHNPRKGRENSKVMLFGPSGKIIEGANDFENSWRASGGNLELLQADGRVHTRFTFHPKGEVFIDTNDSNTGSKVKGKFMIPEPDAARPLSGKDDT